MHRLSRRSSRPCSGSPSHSSRSAVIAAHAHRRECVGTGASLPPCAAVLGLPEYALTHTIHHSISRPAHLSFASVAHNSVITAAIAAVPAGASELVFWARDVGVFSAEPAGLPTAALLVTSDFVTVCVCV